MTKSKNDSNTTEIGDNKENSHTQTNVDKYTHEYLACLLGKNKCNRDHEWENHTGKESDKYSTKETLCVYGKGIVSISYLGVNASECVVECMVFFYLLFNVHPHLERYHLYMRIV